MKTHPFFSFYSLVLIGVLALASPLCAQDEDIFGDTGLGDTGLDDTGLGADGALGSESDPSGTQPQTQEELQKAFDDAIAAGRALQDQGQWNESLAEFQTAIQLSGGRAAEPFFELGKSYFNLDLQQEAQQALGNAILSSGATQAPEMLVEAYLLRGQSFLKSPVQYPEAAEDFIYAIQTDPSNPQAHYFNGRASLLQTMATPGRGQDQAGQAMLQQALQSYTKAIELKSDYGEAYLDRGRVLAQTRQIDFAVEDHKKAVELLGKNSKATADLASTYRLVAAREASEKDADSVLIIENYRNAIASMDTFLTHHTPGERQNPWDQPEPLDVRPNDILLARAETLIDLGNELDRDHASYKLAIRDCDTYLGFDGIGPPEKARAYFSRALANRMMDHRSAAIDDFGNAIRMAQQTSQPFYPQANLRRGIIYFHEGNFDQAINDFEEAKLNPSNPFQTDPRALLWLGLTYTKQENLDEAIRQYTHAIQGYPNYNLAYINRGLAYMKVGRIKHALEDFDTSLRLDSANQVVKGYREAALQSLKEGE